MDIHQMSASYMAEHDRILLRINTGQGEEIKFWWTRRLIMLVWPHFERIDIQMSNQALPTVIAQNSIERKAISEFNEQKVLEETDFQTPYRCGDAFPLGEEALLLTSISIKAVADEVVLNVGCKTNNVSLQIKLTRNLYQTLMILLKKVVKSANWQLTQIGGESESTTTNTTEAEGLTNTASRLKYLH